MKRACPAPTAVTTPPLVTVATATSSLTHVPPVVGDSVEVLPIQSPEEPVMATVGLANTQTVADALDAQPVEASVNIKVAVPAVKPVTRPELLILATNGADEAHVPPVAGVKVVVPAIQIESLPVNVAVGLALTVTEIVLEHPVAVSVYVKVDEPAETPVITPALVMVATPVLLLTQVPPVAGFTCVVPPIHTLSGPGYDKVGGGFTVNVLVVDEQPVAVLT